MKASGKPMRPANLNLGGKVATTHAPGTKRTPKPLSTYTPPPPLKGLAGVKGK